jgi:(p)ppGpp synthase/HD superfamily hydrolase
MNIIDKALQFATEKHEGQVRKVSGEKYITHPIFVAELCRKYKTSKNLDSLIVSCLLHDVVEDCGVTIDEIRSTFGDLTANIVDELTTDVEQVKVLGKTTYLAIKMVNMSSYGLTLKLLDRLSNVMDNPTESYKKSTIDIIQYVKNVRGLNKTQTAIALDIILECIWGS